MTLAVSVLDTRWGLQHSGGDNGGIGFESGRGMPEGESVGPNCGKDSIFIRPIHNFLKAASVLQFQCLRIQLLSVRDTDASSALAPREEIEEQEEKVDARLSGEAGDAERSATGPTSPLCEPAVTVESSRARSPLRGSDSNLGGLLGVLNPAAAPASKMAGEW